ncbi:formyltransferase family protein [Erwinia aphidicola]|uniref:formyltransferase family protein n=1 Tax=Erwinia TaxID=551 RepID=UPI00105CB90B|nr:formyltransferase family protein [Erwinia aphidicola]MCP2231654.1 UDP-4-amino-4-deoxy-L-arabinose formyltransferase/UDP-glucuronic acid dehydrogenase (UDP-4-keto-hexauronic acid decarboxylating) [Erwinia aphidicola]
MKTVVFGYHDMGCSGLQALLAAGYEVMAVFTHADVPGENHFHGSLAQQAAEQGIAVFMPEDINQPSIVAQLRALAPEAIFCFSYRQALNAEIRACASVGAFNVHASLLPAHRGRAHLNWALIKGDKETGVTLHRITERPDAGPILAQQRVAITPQDDVFSLHNKLVATSAAQLALWLPALKAGRLTETEQDESQASSFGARKPEDGEIHWQQSADEVHNLIRALTRPWPGAFSGYQGQRIIIWQSRAINESSPQPPGTLISISPLMVACGSGALEILHAECVAMANMAVGDKLSG